MKVCPIHRLAWLLVVTLVASLGMPTLLRAQNGIEGQVSNGTTGKPVANLELRLLTPQGGMQQVGSAVTDARGHFAFAKGLTNTSSFYLLDTEFESVNYNAPVQFNSIGNATINLKVYNTTPKNSAIRIRSVKILVRAAGSKAQVEEAYDVLNSSKPQRAYVNSHGTLQFHLPSATSQPVVAVVGLMNMPLPQSVEDGKAAGDFSIRYPLKPGLTRVVVSYEANYSTSRLALGDHVNYPIEQAEAYVSPPSLTVTSPIFQPDGTDTTNNVARYQTASLKRDAPLEFTLEGSAPETAEAENQQSDNQQSGNKVKIVPNSMTSLGLLLLTCFLLFLLWALGVRVAKEWPRIKKGSPAAPAHKQLQAKVEAMFNSLADLDELFASKKIPEGKYWKERLELKAKLVTALKKAPSALRESYASRHTSPSR